MTPERFRRIEELYHAAREATAFERAALLARIDPELRRELESLFAQRADDEFLDRPALRNAPELLDDASAASMAAGACLGPYRIESKLGEGGMGEVYRAVDTRLGRAVAIKTVHEQFTSRFEREARAISALNHPNICTLHDVGPNYLVMELVEGETLAALLKSGPLPIPKTILYASQIVAALMEAHSKRIIHRDLKPGNIMIGKSGVKVLDFGLALMGQDESITGSQVIVGTPAYMAPEQRDRKPADARSDIYSFGCVLYEMCTGARVGSSRQKRINPRRLQRIVSRCLEPDPARRWQSVAELHQELAAVRPMSRRAYVGAAGGILLLAAAAGYYSLHRPPKLTARDTVVVGDFENKTGDPVFDQTLRQGLSVQLEQSPFLALVSDQEIQRVLRLMNRPPETRLTREVSGDICERTGGSAVLEGSITELGSQYILWLRARNCRTGEVLAEEQAQAERKEGVLNALSRIAIQIRTRLGESLGTIQQHSTPLEQATTSSLEALKAYSAAKVALYANGASAAIPHYQQAIALDPQFAMAHADLGFMLWNLGQTDLGAAEVRIAYGFRNRVSDRERRYIVMLYDRQVTGNLQKELQTLESWAQTYPRDAYAPGIIAGWVAFGTGQYERGIQASEEAIRLDANIPFPFESIAIHNLRLNRLTQAADALRRAAARNMELPDFLVIRYYLAFLKGDQAGMEREVARAPGQHAQDLMSHHQALVLARSGRMREARTMWERAIQLGRQANNRSPGLYEAAAAICEAHFGNKAAAKGHARAALELAKGRDVEYAAAYALALSGDLPAAQGLAANLEQRFPEDTPVQFEYLPTLRALFALAHGASLDAVQRLQRAVPYDFAMPGTAFVGMFGGVYTAYVRGEAYLAAGRGQEAAAEFQKVLNHPGIVLADPIGALAYWKLGKAYVVSGDKTKAKNAYRDFLALWKDADRDIPVLKQASAEYAKL